MGTQVRITITSTDLTSDDVSIVKQYDIKDSSNNDIALTSGLAKINLGTSNTTVHEGAGSIEEAYIFIYNPSTTKSDKITVVCGTTAIGHVQGMDAVFIPFDQTEDLKLRSNVADSSVEYQIFRA